MELKFLLGYVFEPTDEVLIEHYLLKRMTGEILPVAELNLVSECNLYSEEGLQEAFRRIQELEDKEENDEDDDDVRENSLDHFIPSPTFNKELFFFTPLRKKSHNGNRIDRSVGKGTWKGLDKGHPILDTQGRVIGMKKSFNYDNKGSAQHLQWDMKEYSLDGICLQNPNIKDYAICKIKKKARARGRKRARIENHQVAEEEEEEEEEAGESSSHSHVGAGAGAVLSSIEIEKQTLEEETAAATDIFNNNIEDDAAHGWVLSHISFDDLDF
ncbi:NAC domain-containing protein 2-like [Diospyros lotus]|uniref:NAC domain-containing protein 2-like n=1 Tax=Diospyros lotus TaxID=55363 RepID=UPI00225B282C|nr:NAC domain-containing protein 2-like [Diospyros lotus]